LNFDLTYKPYGSHAILIEWPKVISDTVLNDIIWFKSAIATESKTHIEDLINCYNSLTIKYSHVIKDPANKIEHLKKVYSKINYTEQKKATIWEIPVCYRQEYGLDLLALSKAKSTTIKDIIKLHSNTLYSVYFIGFLPGFLYLGGLDSRLHTNRKATPRLSIAKGSVGIGGSQTGIYPNNSAGGWNIIGRTPVSFFDVLKTKPCFAEAGDKIKFVPITQAKYLQIEKEVKNNTFKLESARYA